MTNYIQPGNSIEVLASAGGYTAGEIVKVGSFIGVSFGTYAENDTAVISLEGVYEVPKLAPQVQAIGVPLYFDESEGHLTTDPAAGANLLAGHAFVAALSADTTVKVRLSA